MNRRAFLSTAAIGLAGVALPAGLRAATSPVPQGMTPASTGVRPELLARAYQAFAKHQRSIIRRDVIAIADFGVPSREPRFHLLDMLNGRTSSFLVAHGKGSDRDHSGWLQQFSNIPGSEATSSGSYLVGQTYIGEHGYSRRLGGLDPENNNAASRAIVIHPAWYVSSTLANEQGKIGRSQGCFALPTEDIAQVISRLSTGSLLYADKV